MIPFGEYAARVQAYLERRGIAVVTRDIPDPLTGDLDGAAIEVDYLLTAEERLFLLAHLFGHTVQWNTGDSELGQPQTPPVEPELVGRLLEYEREAAEYALGMLHEVGITELDGWFSDYAASDAAYLEHFYRTGEKRALGEFRRTGAARIEPREAPEFVPVRRPRRSDGIVI